MLSCTERGYMNTSTDLLLADEPLDARAIKALKPNVLKDKLKERGLSIQGQKKDLIQRLIDYEDERAL
jgi:hypothetical protein